MGFAYGGRTVTATPTGKPKPIKAQMERSDSEERDQIDRPPVREEDEPAPRPGASGEASESEGWWRASAPASDWAEPVGEAPTTEIAQRKDSGTADVYFCGRTNLFPLNLAIRAIGKENL